jgi:hypothetical protein
MLCVIYKKAELQYFIDIPDLLPTVFPIIPPVGFTRAGRLRIVVTILIV